MRLSARGWFHATLARGQGAALLFCTVIAALSQNPGWSDLLFPELGALSSTVLRDPDGPWAQRRWQLLLLPTLCASVGLLISRSSSDPLVAVLLAVALAKLVLLVARSTLVPALSAAALPVILHIHSWTYPLQIGLGLLALCLLLRWWTRDGGGALSQPVPEAVRAVEAPARQGWGLLRWAALLVLLLAMERLLGLRYVLVPPLIVLAHEGLLEPLHCPWADRTWVLPLACGGTTLAGVLSAQLLPWAGPAAALSLAITLLLLHRLRLQLAPVLALALLPLVLPAPDLRMVPAVLLGASLLAVAVSWSRQATAGSPSRRPPRPAAPRDRSRGRH
jgi:hypothetical protein